MSPPDLQTVIHLALLFIGLATLGAICGYLAGLVRSGGGALLAPALWLVFAGAGLPGQGGLASAAATAIGSALAIQALLSARALAARGGLAAADRALLRALAVPAAIGAILAPLAAAALPERALLGALGATLFLLGLRRAFPPRGAKAALEGTSGAAGPAVLGAAAFLATLSGQGAGAIGPVALALLGRESEGAANRAALAAAGLLWTALGAAGFLLAGARAGGLGLDAAFSIGWINLAALAAATPLWIAAAPLGAAMAARIGPALVRPAFALALTALGLVLLRAAALG